MNIWIKNDRLKLPKALKSYRKLKTSMILLPILLILWHPSHFALYISHKIEIISYLKICLLLFLYSIMSYMFSMSSNNHQKQF